jgi:type I restriction enzyme S subunit
MSPSPQTSVAEGETNPALVPKLRFPEFRETEGWNSGPLKNALSSISNGLALGQVSVASGYRVTRIETISAGTIDLAKIGWIQTSEDISAYKLKAGDILLSNINSVAHIGKSVFVDREYDLHHGMNLLRLEVNRNQHDPKFIFYAINTDWIRAALRERANKAVNQASINQTELGKSEVSLPLRPEQQKIAECLSSVDELMAAQARKVDALKTHKKGLMQQLFPREGETQPRLRFPEFQNAGEWQQKPLSGLCRIRTGKKDANEGAADGAYPFFTCAEKHIYSHNYSFDAEAILIAGNANVGQTSYYIGKFEAYQRTYVLTDFKGIFVPYLYSLLNANLRPDLLAQVQTSAMSYIRLPMLEEYQINAPPSQAEQHRIATCLSSLDALITAETQKHENLKTHKRGLMQQLFPSPEEATS